MHQEEVKRTRKAGLKGLRCTMGKAKEAGADITRRVSASGASSPRARRSTSPMAPASAARLSRALHSVTGTAAQMNNRFSASGRAIHGIKLWDRKVSCFLSFWPGRRHGCAKGLELFAILTALELGRSSNLIEIEGLTFAYASITHIHLLVALHIGLSHPV